MLKKNALVVSTVAALSLMGCAHQSVVPPSQGHIDGSSTQSSPATNKADIPKPVKSNVYLPPPKPRAKEPTYSVVVNEVPVKEILFALARESKLNIDIHPSIQGRVTLNAVDQTLPAILERLAKQVDLTYKLEGNVLSITPDLPVLRSYKVDYVNMSRDTTGFIGVAAEIASAGRGATTGTSGAASGSTSSGATGGATGGVGGVATNSSRTQVQSLSRQHFWESLVQNIRDILSETDKEIVVGRVEGDKQQANLDSRANNENSTNLGDGAAGNTQKTGTNTSLQVDSQKALTEYKTLLAATVIANPETGIISVRATSKQHEKVQEFLDKVMASAKRQVLIEATIVEVRLNDGYQAGIDWSRLNSPGNSGFTLQQSFTPLIPQSSSNTLATPGLIAGFVNASSNFAASISLLKQFGEAKVLSSPKLMVLNNQTAVLKVVDNLVYFTIQAQISQATVAGGGNLQSVTTTPNTVPVGVVMTVTPQINDNGDVNINVRPTISSLIRYVPDPNPQIPVGLNNGIPEIQVREMESMLQIGSGNTAVLGGLMQDQIQRNTDKVPGLSDIPGLGRLFTGRNDVSRKTELVIFLRPTVIKSASLESDELQSYKQYLPEQQLNQTLEGNGY